MSLEVVAKSLPSESIKRGRRMAVQFLYGFDFNKDIALWRSAYQVFQETHQIPEELRPYTEELVVATIKSLSKIDSLISSRCHNWSLSRIGRVDLAVLRVCVSESLERSSLKRKILISDAAEIGKEYGGEHSKGFINGVLDGVISDLEKK